MKKLVVLLILFFVIGCINKKEITWVAIGDSITYLNEHTNETGNRVTKGYMTLVTEKLPNIHYINHGYNGWTSGGIAEAIENLNFQKADVYSILLGTNDWWQGRPVGTFKDYQNNTGSKTFYGAFRIIINKLNSLNKNARIILITPMQRADFVYINDMKNNAYGSYKEKNGQSLEQFANTIDSIANYQHVKVVDLFHNGDMTIKDLVKYKRLKDPQSGTYKNYPYPEYIDIPLNPETDEHPYPVDAIDITYDGLHPSDKGNAVIAEMLVKIMEEIKE